MTSLRLVVGSGIAARGAHALLAARLVDHARSLGLTVQRVELSRCARSPSRYLQLLDRQHRPWILRVSNHRRLNETGHDVPHLDLVSIDGTSGFEPAARYLGEIAAGTATWSAPERSRCRKRHRR